MATVEIVLQSIDKMSGDLKNVQTKLGGLDKGLVRTQGTSAKVNETFSVFSGTLKGLGTQIVVFNQGLQLARQGMRLFQATIGSAINSAASFQKAMGNLATLIDDKTGKQIGLLKEGILDLLGVLPVTADELGAAAYQILSAGITDVTSALRVLEASTRLAVAGLGSTTDAVNIITSASICSPIWQ